MCLEFESFKDKWNSQYSISIKSWENNWEELATFFKYPEEIRKMIYTTNAMESNNRQLRKVTKNRSIFPSDEALFKILYLATIDTTHKWTQNVRCWATILGQLAIHFEERFNIDAV